MQLASDNISRGFADAHNLAEIAIREITFHELLSLGEYLSRPQGWDIKDIQTLPGHTSERLTRHPFEEHK